MFRRISIHNLLTVVCCSVCMKINRRIPSKGSQAIEDTQTSKNEAVIIKKKKTRKITRDFKTLVTATSG